MPKTIAAKIALNDASVTPNPMMECVTMYVATEATPDTTVPLTF